MIQRATKWVVHVAGPDEVIEFESEEDARRTAVAINMLAAYAFTQPLDPKVEAVVWPPRSQVLGGAS